MEFYLEYCYSVYQTPTGNSCIPRSHSIYLIAFWRILVYSGGFQKIEIVHYLHIYIYLYIYNQINKLKYIIGKLSLLFIYKF